MIELDPNRSFAVQKAELEVGRLKREVRQAEKTLEFQKTKLKEAEEQLEAIKLKEQK